VVVARIQILKKMSLFERLYTGEWLSESKAEVEGKMSLFESLYTGEWLSESKEVEDEDMENIPKVTVKKEPLLLQSVQRAFVATGAPTREKKDPLLLQSVKMENRAPLQSIDSKPLLLQSVKMENVKKEPLLSQSVKMENVKKNRSGNQIDVILKGEAESRKRKEVFDEESTPRNIPKCKGERKAVVEGSGVPAVKVNIPKPKEKIRPQMKIEGEQSCHKMQDDFPYQIKMGIYYYGLFVSESTYSTGFGNSKRDHETTLVFRLKKEFALNDRGSTVEVATKEVANFRLVNFKLDLSDEEKEHDAELTLRLIFLFLKIAFPLCQSFENCVYEQKDRHQGCTAKRLKAFFKRINFFQLADLAMEVFQPTVKKASADFDNFINTSPFERQIFPRYAGVPRK